MLQKVINDAVRITQRIRGIYCYRFLPSPTAIATLVGQYYKCFRCRSLVAYHMTTVVNTVMQVPSEFTDLLIMTSTFSQWLACAHRSRN